MKELTCYFCGKEAKPFYHVGDQIVCQTCREKLDEIVDEIMDEMLKDAEILPIEAPRAPISASFSYDPNRKVVAFNLAGKVDIGRLTDG